MPKTWTPAEDQYIIDNYGILSGNEMCRHLEIHNDTLNRRLEFLGLHDRPKPTLKPKIVRLKQPKKKVVKEFPAHIFNDFFIDYQDVSCSNGGLIK